MKQKTRLQHCWHDADGFTLAELLVVVSILTVLAALIAPVFAAQADKAHDATTQHRVSGAGRFVTTGHMQGTLSGAIDGSAGTIYFGEAYLPTNGVKAHVTNTSGGTVGNFCLSGVSETGRVYAYTRDSQKVYETESAVECSSASSSPVGAVSVVGGSAPAVASLNASAVNSGGWRYIVVDGITEEVEPGQLVYLWIQAPLAGTPTYVMWAVVQVSPDGYYLFNHINGGTLIVESGTYDVTVTSTWNLDSVIAHGEHVEL